MRSFFSTTVSIRQDETYARGARACRHTTCDGRTTVATATPRRQYLVIGRGDSSVLLRSRRRGQTDRTIDRTTRAETRSENRFVEVQSPHRIVITAHERALASRKTIEQFRNICSNRLFFSLVGVTRCTYAYTARGLKGVSRRRSRLFIHVCSGS